jgi:hypothetical protein
MPKNLYPIIDYYYYFHFFFIIPKNKTFKVGELVLFKNVFNIRVKYVFAPCGLTFLFFAHSGSFRIEEGILFMDKDKNSISVQTSVQKLTEVHVNTSQKLTRVICINK